jgi:hypothetical protein
LDSGALAARVADLQMVLMAVSAISLVVAHYLAHRKAGSGQRRQPIILWTTTALSVCFVVAPAMLR